MNERETEKRTNGAENEHKIVTPSHWCVDRYGRNLNGVSGRFYCFRWNKIGGIFAQ